MSDRPTVKSERALAEFALLADAQAMKPLLRRTVENEFFGGWRIAEVTIRSIRSRSYDDEVRRERSSVLVGYDLVLEHVTSPRTKNTDLYLKAFLDGRGSRQVLGDVHLAVALPDLDAYTWIFPGDPALPHLATLTDPHAVAERLPYASPHLSLTSAADVSTIDVTPLRYKPEDRCTLGLQVTSRRGHRQSLIAKAFSSSSRGSELDRVTTELWNRATRPGARFNVARPMGVDGATGTVWLSHLPGRSPRREDLDEEAVRHIAAAIGSFHCADPIVDVHRTADDLLHETARKAETLALLFPSLKTELTGLIGRMESGPELPTARRTTNVHGAFRLRQLLLDGPEVGIVDFDSAAIGDPTEDVVDILLDLDPLMGGSDRQSPLVSAFVEAYEAEVGRPLDLEIIRWHLPIQLLKRAYWLRHTALHRPSVANEMFRRVARACTADQHSLLDEAGRCRN